jgi:predicted dehydrogenase
MVFCEWLLGNETAEAKALTAMAKEKGIKTFAGLQACPA